MFMRQVNLDGHGQMGNVRQKRLRSRTGGMLKQIVIQLLSRTPIA